MKRTYNIEKLKRSYRSAHNKLTPPKDLTGKNLIIEKSGHYWHINYK